MPSSTSIRLLFTLLAASPVARALNWTGSYGSPAFSDASGEKIKGVNLGGLFILENVSPAVLWIVDFAGGLKFGLAVDGE